MSQSSLKIARYAGLGLAVAGLALLITGAIVGRSVFPDTVFTVEPVSYFGALGLVLGLGIALAAYAISARRKPKDDEASNWSQVTQDYFDTFSHDMGRPFRRILGKQREVRARLEESGIEMPPAVLDLMDEIEQQAPSFRLMLANVRVLVELEDPAARPVMEPIDPAAIVRNIADRYYGIAVDHGAELSWWSEPSEFGLVYGDAAALDHVVTNLVDNSVKFACKHIEVRLTRNPTHYLIRIWDDGPGIPESHIPHLFDRGWTPQVAGRQEKTSSGLGLYIARTLARRSGGDIAAESATGKSPGQSEDSGHYTSMTVMLPLRDRNGLEDTARRGA
jgi:signal transduction histidine kinase